MKAPFKLVALFCIISLSFSCSSDDNNNGDDNIPEETTVTDVDGNVYETIQIGDQVWMLENLKVTKLNDGTAIALHTSTPGNDDWWDNSRTTSMYTWPVTADLNNVHDEELPEDYYGAIYSRGAIATGKLAPDGWRVPTAADFTALETYLEDAEITDLSSAVRSTIGWANDNNGTNTSNFNALPNGYCTATGNATGAQVIATFLTANSTSDEHTIVQFSSFNVDFSVSQSDNRFCGAIRCIKE